jgi:hypothetical protein
VIQIKIKEMKIKLYKVSSTTILQINLIKYYNYHISGHYLSTVLFIFKIRSFGGWIMSPFSGAVYSIASGRERELICLRTDYKMWDSECLKDPMGLQGLLQGQVYTRRMPSSRMLRRMALVLTDVSEKGIASIIRVKTIGELGTTLAVTSK